MKMSKNIKFGLGVFVFFLIVTKLVVTRIHACPTQFGKSLLDKCEISYKDLNNMDS